MRRPISLKRGDTWHEPLKLGTVRDVVVTDYGDGALPILDGSEPVTGWTDLGHGTYAVSWAHTIGRNKADVFLWETDAGGATVLPLLTRVPAVGDLVPGTYHVDYGAGTGPATSPVTITLAPRAGGTAPESGRYVATYYTNAIRIGAAGRIEGIQARRQGDENGVWAGSGSVVSRCYVEDFGIHAVTILGDGGVIEDVVALRPSPIVPGSARKNIVFVMALPTAPGAEAHFLRTWAIGGSDGGAGTDPAQLASTHAITTHASSATPTLVHALARIEGGGAIDISGGVQCVAARVEIDTYYARGTSVAVNPTTAALHIWRLIANRLGPTAIKLLLPSGVTSGEMTLRESLVYSVTTEPSLVVSPPSGVALTVENSVLASTTSRTLAMQGDSLTVRRSVLMTGGHAVDAGGSAGGTGTYTGDHNLFLFPGGTFQARYRGTVYTSLAAWQVATGQDWNSVALLGPAAAVVLASIASGDARLPSGLLDGTPLQGIPVGMMAPPSAWPSVPETAAAAAAYVASL